MTEHDNGIDPVADGLDRLFADDRLRLTPVAGASEAIVRGARRARRRREIAYVAGGSTAAAFVLVAGVMIAVQPGEERVPVAAPPSTSEYESSKHATQSSSAEPEQREKAPPPARPNTTSETSEPAPRQTSKSSKPPATSQESVPEGPLLSSTSLGPSGYGKLELGLTFGELKATGMLAKGSEPPPKGGCEDYRLREGDTSIRVVTVSDEAGLAALIASGAKTPEGVGIGSTKEEVESAYPGETEDGGSYSISTGSGGSYLIGMDDEGVVESLHLVADGHPAREC